jgi:hypothetical protein
MNKKILGAFIFSTLLMVAYSFLSGSLNSVSYITDVLSTSYVNDLSVFLLGLASFAILPAVYATLITF